MLASKLWALAHASDARKLGKEAQLEDSECHWCAGKCSRKFVHDDAPPVPFVRSRSKAVRPGNPWICNGCYLFRRRRLTVRFLDEAQSFRDAQCPLGWGWWLTERGAWALRINEAITIWELLLKPPLTFALAFLDWGRPGEACDNLVHLWETNDLETIEGGTPLRFTINNVPHTYSCYELKQGLSKKGAPMAAGVRALVELLGPCPRLEALKEEPGKAGDMRSKDGPKKVVNPGKG
jgi:hypothetical protein